jgi:hypothetical protein
MQTAPFDHGVRPWFKKASAKEQPSQIEIRTFGSRVRERGLVSRREKLLLASVLLVVGGWIIFRMLLTFLTLD